MLTLISDGAVRTVGAERMGRYAHNLQGPNLADQSELLFFNCIELSPSLKVLSARQTTEIKSKARNDL